jgi:hypothetical protein
LDSDLVRGFAAKRRLSLHFHCYIHTPNRCIPKRCHGDPLPAPGLLPPALTVVVFAVEAPHPTMTTTWSANANQQRNERRS